MLQSLQDLLNTEGIDDDNASHGTGYSGQTRTREQAEVPKQPHLRYFLWSFGLLIASRVTCQIRSLLAGENCFRTYGSPSTPARLYTSAGASVATNISEDRTGRGRRLLMSPVNLIMAAMETIRVSEARSIACHRCLFHGYASLLVLLLDLIGSR